MIYCDNCGLANRDGSRFCNDCGHLLGNWMRCPQCSFLNPSTGRFCNDCGGRLREASDTSSPRQESAPSVLPPLSELPSLTLQEPVVIPQAIVQNVGEQQPLIGLPPELPDDDLPELEAELVGVSQIGEAVGEEVAMVAPEVVLDSIRLIELPREGVVDPSAMETAAEEHSFKGALDIEGVEPAEAHAPAVDTLQPILGEEKVASGPASSIEEQNWVLAQAEAEPPFEEERSASAVLPAERVSDEPEREPGRRADVDEQALPSWLQSETAPATQMADAAAEVLERPTAIPQVENSPGELATSLAVALAGRIAVTPRKMAEGGASAEFGAASKVFERVASSPIGHKILDVKPAKAKRGRGRVLTVIGLLAIVVALLAIMYLVQTQSIVLDLSIPTKLPLP